MRNREEVVVPVTYHDANGQQLIAGDTIKITHTGGEQETHLLKSQHGEPPVIKKGDSYLPLPYLLSKKSLKVEKL